MRKITIYNVQFTIFAVSLVFYILHFTFYIPVALATDSTPSSSIQQKLEELKTSIASKAAKFKQEINKKLENKFFYGSLILKSPTSLDLETKTGQKKIIINEDTNYEELGKILPAGRQVKTKFSYKTLLKDNYVAALGEIDDQGFLHAKKIVLLPQPKAGQPLADKTYLWGRIISREDNLIIIETKDKKRVPVSIAKITAKYKIGDTVIITGNIGKDDIIELTFLFPLQ